MSDIDYPSLIEPVARHFWGEPNKSLTTAIGLRFGTSGSKSIVFKTGEWYDHEQHQGGGVLKLIVREVEHVTNEADAVRWLEDNRFIAAGQPRQATEDHHAAPEVPPEHEASPDASGSEEREVEVEAYDYTDAAGVFQYRVIRYRFEHPDGTPVIGKHGNPKKTFRQKSRDASGKTTWGLNGRSICLYHWPQLQLAVEEHKTVFICEGEKDVHTLEAWGFVATTNSGGAQNWRPEFAETFRGADVVILGDDDEAGIPRVEAIGLSLRGVAERIRAVGKWDGQKDVTDWRDKAGGTAERLSAIIGQLPEWRPAPPKSAFNAAHVGEVDERRKRRRHDWLVQDFIEAGGMCSFSGMSQAGKTFAVTELAFCVGQGKPFFGREVKQGLVIYQVGEGELGFEKRLDGYARDRGIDLSAVPFIYWPRKINLFVDDKDTEAMIAEAKAWAAYYDMPIAMMVIDTFNKATRGANEISGQDMGKVINNTERLAAELGCTVLVIDHVNKSGDVRGHGSKVMDVTNSVKVVTTEKVDQNGRKIRRMVLDKNKDGENGQSISFVLRQVVVGEDQHGRQETTCVVEAPDGNEDEIIASGRLPVGMATLLRMVKDTADIEGEAAPPELVQVPPGRNVAKWDAVVSRFRRNWTFTASEPKARDKELARVIAEAGRRLLLAGYIGRDNDRGFIWWTGKEDRLRRPAEPKPEKREQPLSPYLSKEDMTEVPF